MSARTDVIYTIKHLKIRKIWKHTSHSYKLANFTCAECEFIVECELTMDLHVGRFHSKDFDCGKTGILSKAMNKKNKQHRIMQILTKEVGYGTFNLTEILSVKSLTLDTGWRNWIINYCGHLSLYLIAFFLRSLA